LVDGIVVDQFNIVWPGYSGTFKAEFNECTGGNPAYEAYNILGDSTERYLPGLAVQIHGAGPIRQDGVAFITPDGLAVLHECNRFYVCLVGEEEESLEALLDDQKTVSRSRATSLVNNIYRALFAPETAPAHWRL
jgi:hypothetical protein